MITRVHHVGIVVEALDDAYGFWRETLGLPLLREAELPDQGVRAALLGCGPCEVELLEPTLPDTGVARFFARHGEGLHHLCLESDDVWREAKRLRAWGVELLDERPRKGLAGLIVFMHPRSCAGTLVELATPTDHASPPESPLAMTGVDLAVEDVRVAAHRFRDLFSLPLEGSDAAWSRAELRVGGLALRVAATAAGQKPGIAALSIVAPRLGDVAARLDRPAAGPYPGSGLPLDATVTHGVPLVIGEPQAREDRP